MLLRLRRNSICAGGNLINSTNLGTFSTDLAISARGWGGLEMTNSVLHLPFKLPVFEILLIVSGMILLAGELFQTGQKGIRDLR